MACSRLNIHLFLLIFLSARCDELDKARDCKFITCRDCATVGCSWAFYFDRDPNCVASTLGLPGVVSEVDDPKDCDKPTCVLPDRGAADGTGLAELLGGIFGGLLAGFFGGAGIQNWRQGRAGYERIGRRSWRDLAQAFLAACLCRLGRADEEAFLHGDDGDDEARRQAAVRRNAHLNAEARREAEARDQVPAAEPPIAEPHPAARPPIAEARDEVPAAEPPMAEPHAAARPPIDEPQELVNPPAVVNEEPPLSPAVVLGDSDDDLDIGHYTDSDGDEGDDAEGGRDGGGDEEGDDDDEGGDDEGGDGQGDNGPGPSSLVQQAAAPRQSKRQAAVNANANILALRIQKKI